MLVAGAIAQGSDEALANARPDELVQILDSLDAENDRLEQEKRRLAAEVASLTSGSDAAALEQARNRRSPSRSSPGRRRCAARACGS